MINTSLCVYEESVREDDYDFTIHYFVYPKAMNEVNFEDEQVYVGYSQGEITRMCIALAVYDSGAITLQMSPTIEDEDGFFDVDWRDLEPNVNYDDTTISDLLKIVAKHSVGGTQ